LEKGLIGAKSDEELRKTLLPYFEPDAELSFRLRFRGLATHLIRTPIREKPRTTIFQSFRQNDDRAFQRLNRLPSRILANALAGVPELSVRSSYDICASHPSIKVVGLNIWIHYARKFPEVCPIPIWEEHLLRRRDALVEMIEGNWPALLQLMHQIRRGLFGKKIQAARELKRLLYDPSLHNSELWRLRETSNFLTMLKEIKSFIQTHASEVPPARKILAEVSQRPDEAPKLLNGLLSRMLANAIAGIPELSCQRSFEVCSHKPSTLPAHETTVTYYSRMP
jgi:hypothetical protein